jgi:hypothetical protein
MIVSLNDGTTKRFQEPGVGWWWYRRCKREEDCCVYLTPLHSRDGVTRGVSDKNTRQPIFVNGHQKGARVKSVFAFEP